MKTRPLFTVTALIEVGAGLMLALAPSLATVLIFGTQIETATERALAALAGSALLALGTACSLARNLQGRMAHSLLAALLVYNTGAVAVLAGAGFASGLRGPVLWPAILLHAALAFWCIACLRIGQV